MGKLVQIKTQATTAVVEDFLNTIADPTKRDDSFKLLSIMMTSTGEKPKMWGTSIIGFGEVRYKSPKTGREVNWFKIGFSPRKANLSLHLVIDINALQDELQMLGKHKTGVGCLYINKLEDVNLSVLEKIIQSAAKNP
ncbi:YdhG-like domain-containing protein [Flavobacterium longum]|uniref:DUF1801 domain-containing protein n=1 Tax=Flavobacterium longum TaxID=1299340 RepID=UPI0039ECB142